MDLLHHFSFGVIFILFSQLSHVSNTRVAVSIHWQNLACLQEIPSKKPPAHTVCEFSLTFFSFLSTALFRTSTDGSLCNSLCHCTIIPSLPKHFPTESSIRGGANSARARALRHQPNEQMPHLCVCLRDYKVAAFLFWPLSYRHEC